MRASPGQYTTGATHSRRQIYRMLFLEAAIQAEPQLNVTLFQIYRKHRGSVRFDASAAEIQRFMAFSCDQLLDCGDPLGEVRRSVEGWAQTFNLTNGDAAPEWVLESVYWSFGQWQSGGSPEIMALPGVSEALPTIDYTIVPPEYQRREWNPFFGGTRREFERDLTAHLKRVKEFVVRRLDEIENSVRTAGCQPASTNLNPQRVVWAARYQVAGVEVSDFKKFGLHADAPGIRSAIREVLAEVGLTRRPTKNRGRPKKGKI
jgi:hypothetical protein